MHVRREDFKLFWFVMFVACFMGSAAGTALIKLLQIVLSQ